MGGKVAVEFAVRHPRWVDRLVLLCPAGLADEERLPLVEGVRHNDPQAVVASVFCDPRHAAPSLVETYRRRFADKRWRGGLLRTIRGTMGHSVRERLAELTQPTLLIVGREDRIVDPRQALAAGRRLQHGRLVEVPDCGHAPQIERADEINALVLEFLTRATPGSPT
jgi:pimeloyl-ACP methyl ester carboxylesterase